VVNDDTGGTTGVLRAWSLTLHTLPGLTPDGPLTASGAGGAIPDNTAEGRASTVHVAGAGLRLQDVDVTVDIAHPNASDLDLFLTAPSGRRIELVTDVGGGADDLYAGTIFDDQAGEPIGDTTLPTTGPFTRVVPEGALAAFTGEDPNGDWTLTVADDAGGSTGLLGGWSLTVTTGTACGDGTLDAGEVCDDGNAVNGDGCDESCTPTACGNGVVTGGEDCDDGNTTTGDACPATCRTAETRCSDCLDDDGNGLVDSADPACGATALELRRATLTSARRGRLRLAAGLALPDGAAGGVAVVVADGNGPLVCALLGELRAGRRPRPVKAGVGGGRMTLKLVPRAGGLTVAARGVDLGALDDPALLLGVRVGDHHFAGGGTLRNRGAGRWVHP
jgi:cysteine-rich repeat protein